MAAVGADEEGMRKKCTERTRQGRSSRKGAVGKMEGKQTGEERL